jgi:hypothetical protein
MTRCGKNGRIDRRARDRLAFEAGSSLRVLQSSRAELISFVVTELN